MSELLRHHCGWIRDELYHLTMRLFHALILPYVSEGLWRGFVFLRKRSSSKRLLRHKVHTGNVHLGCITLQVKISPLETSARIQTKCLGTEELLPLPLPSFILDSHSLAARRIEIIISSAYHRRRRMGA